MKVSQISIPSVGGVIPTNSFFNFNFILGLIVGGLSVLVIFKLLWPRSETKNNSEKAPQFRKN